jgi:eukaryotic-like serine/threonine-protein kinase
MDKIAEQPTVAGLEKLAQPNRDEVVRRGEAHAQAWAGQQQLEWRAQLHEAAVQSFTRLGNELLEAVRDVAPAADTELEAGRGKIVFVATLNGARLGLARPKPSSAIWTTPFTVISEAGITINLPGDVHGWRGRGHSLWFCEAKEEGWFAWHEMAFMDFAFTQPPAIVPYPLSAAEGRAAFRDRDRQTAACLACRGD